MVNISPEPATRQPSKTSLRALDTANFFLADVRDGLGPYLDIYLLTTLNWQAQDIGITMSVMGIATVIAQTPAGALVDRTHRKHVYSIIASLLIPLPAHDYRAHLPHNHGWAGFYGYTALAVVALGVLWFFVPETSSQKS